MGRSKTHRLVQLTDFHLGSTSDLSYRGVNSSESLAQVLAHLRSNGPPPDRYLLTGDLAEDATPATYDRVADAFSGFTAPIHFIPGNHDNRELMHAHLIAAGFKGEPVIVWGNWCILLLDSSQHESPKGKLGASACQWLSKTLEAMKDFWVVIALHHHPIASGSAWMDTMMIEDRESFLEIIHAHGKVKAVIFGHVHQEIDKMWGRIRFLGSPSTCVQFKPGNHTFATDDMRPGYRWIELDEGGQLSTQIMRVGPNG